MIPGLDLSYAGPAQPLTTAGKDLDDLQIMIYLIYLSEVCIFPVTAGATHHRWSTVSAFQYCS